VRSCAQIAGQEIKPNSNVAFASQMCFMVTPRLFAGYHGDSAGTG
jgi:hypothetical protein